MWDTCGSARRVVWLRDQRPVCMCASTRVRRGSQARYTYLIELERGYKYLHEGARW